VAAFTHGHAAEGLEIVRNRMIAHARIVRVEAVSIYIIFGIFGTGAIIFGTLANSWLSIVGGVLTFAIEGFGYWLDRKKAPPDDSPKVAAFSGP
jgi:hypothetical protein